jgi:hypothetical protein
MSMSHIKEQKLKNGGCIKYRVPNVIEQLQFFSHSGWYSEQCQSDIYLRTLKAIEAGRAFIVAIEGAIDSIDELLNDRENVDAFIEMAWDLAGARLSESAKKP